MSLPLEVENQAGNSVALAKVCPLHKGMAIACCCAAMAALAPVALVQLRILTDLPDPPGRLFDSRRIITSKGAYHLGIPDGVLGLASYGVTLGLLMASQPSRPLVRRVLRGKLAWDATMAIRKIRNQIMQHGRVCSWCVGAAVATAGLVYFAHKAREAERLHTV
jgi:uncharacterized membrane protein